MGGEGGAAGQSSRPSFGAIILRRTSDGWWCIDEFAADGMYIGSTGGNYSCPITTPGWNWPATAVRLADLDIPAGVAPPVEKSYRGIVVIRNGYKLCASCMAKGCMGKWSCGVGAEDDEQEVWISDEPCECCELDVEANDGFGI